MTTSNKFKFTLVVLVVFSLGSTLFIGNGVTNLDIPEKDAIDTTSNSFLTSTITLDGNLSLNEWANAEHKVEWFMDADDANGNPDGYNYMYIDEDIDNLYIALDLCSDQTNDENREWVGVWLNTNATQVFNETWEAPTEWETALNRGMESLVHDIDNNETMEFFDWGFLTFDWRTPDEWLVINGSVDGTQNDIWSNDNQYFNITSEFNGTDYVTRIDFDFDFHDIFPVFEDMYMEQVQNVSINLWALHNVTIDDHYLSVSDNVGNLNPEINESLGTGTSEYNNVIDIQRENFTSGTNVRISMTAVNNAPFNTSIDYLQFVTQFTQRKNTGSGSVYPYSSIQNYDIAWTFGPSENNASDHRQFEIKIPKSELEGYAMDTDLGIIVGGYGTLISFPNTHNWVHANKTLSGIPEEDSNEYNNFTMPMKGWTPPSDPVLTTFSPDPDPDGNILVDWNDDAEVISWSVYRHSSEITVSNLNEATEVASGLAVSQYNDTSLLNGTYWYAVVAIDSFDYAHLSNSLSVTVEISAPVTSTTTTTTTTSTTSTTTTTTTTGTSTTETTTPPPVDGDTTLYLVIAGAGAAGVIIVVVLIVMKKR